MSYRIRFVGNDLVIDTPDGETHDLGPVPGTDPLDAGMSPRQVLQLVEQWAAEQGDNLKGSPGKDANPLVVADKLFKPVTERVIRELSEPVTARLEDGLLDRLVDRLSKPALRALATQLLKPVASEIAAVMPDPAAAARSEALDWVESNTELLTGPVGPVPRHQWKGTSIRFETPDGWGAWRQIADDNKKTSEASATAPGNVNERLPILNIADGSLRSDAFVDARGLRYEVA